jgi:hypothetical protein
MNLELVEHDRLGELAATVNDEYALMTGDMTRAVKRAIRIGELLSEAKAEVAHGEWIPWVEENLTFGQDMASKYMRLYRKQERVLDFGATSIREAVALLAAPKDEPEDVQTSTQPSAPDPSDIAPVLDDEPDTEPEYRNDPALERDLTDAKDAAKRAAEKVAAANRAIAEKELELSKLRKLKADKERVETALRDLHELEKRKTELFKDAESTKLVHQTLARSREFFTRECMQIAALKLRPESVKVMRQDFEGLIELVENWLEAMKGRFL